MIRINVPMKKREEATRAVTAAYVLVCLPNDIANSAMVDAVGEIRKAGLLRQAIKKACSGAMQAYDHYQIRLKEQLQANNRWEFWNDYAEEYQEQLRPQTDKIFEEFRRVLTESNIKDAKVKAHVLMTDVLLQFATLNYDKYFEAMKEKVGVDVEPLFRIARLQGVKQRWDRLRELLCKDDNKELDLNEDEELSKAVRAYELRVIDSEVVNKAGLKILRELYPELISTETRS